MASWEWECASCAFSLLCSLALSYSVCVLFIYLFYYSLNACFLVRDQRVDMDGRESREELEGVGEEKLIRSYEKIVCSQWPTKLVF